MKEMNEVLNRQVSIRRLYESVERYAAGKKGMVYAVSMAHARQIAACYNAHGVSAVAIDSKTPASERRELVCRGRFRQGRIRVLVNRGYLFRGLRLSRCGVRAAGSSHAFTGEILATGGEGDYRKSGDKESCMLIE
ncbi:MAG: hypothetical protein ACLUVG_02560 [Phocaeicola vulgatus]